ncbi:MAG: hypothetical protein OEM59_04870 [Rhodospirillales bacterium]|nr:hypothetical protein [Rhodospirillales bacterium]
MCIVIVRQGQDRFAFAVAAGLRDRGWPVLEIDPVTLADQSVSLSDNTFEVDGRKVSGLLFRAGTRGPFSQGFVLQDKSFVDAEVAAVWMAAMNLSTMTSLNRLDAEAWCLGNLWIIWRRFLLENGVPLAPMSYGTEPQSKAEQWLPYGALCTHVVPGERAGACLLAPLVGSPSPERSLFVCGSILRGGTTNVLIKVAELLCQRGINLAEGLVNRDGQLVAINLLPDVEDSEIDCVRSRVVAYYEANLSAG